MPGEIAIIGLLAVAGVALAVLGIVLARRGRDRRRELARRARQLKAMSSEAAHRLMGRLTDFQDLDAWRDDYEAWCRRVAERLARDFAEADRTMFEADHIPDPASLARSRTPRRDAFRSQLAEKLRRLDAVADRYLHEGARQ